MLALCVNVWRNISFSRYFPKSLVQSLSNALGQTLEYSAPFNVESRLARIIVAVDIQTSNPTLKWGGNIELGRGRGEGIFSTV